MRNAMRELVENAKNNAFQNPLHPSPRLEFVYFLVACYATPYSALSVHPSVGPSASVRRCVCNTLLHWRLWVWVNLLYRSCPNAPLT